MKGFEPSIDLDFENGFFEKGCQLNNYFFGTSALVEVVTGHIKNERI